MPKRHRVEADVYLYQYSTPALGGGGWLAPRPSRFTPGERDPVPIVWEAGWASGAVWMGTKTLAVPGFEPPTVQHVARSYTD